jgi:histidinol phosphatase-like enzyme (inositol monophosphatase family)
VSVAESRTPDNSKVLAQGVSDRATFGRTLAIEAARRTLRWFPGPVAWTNASGLQSGATAAASLDTVAKGDGSPVTAADRDAETFLREQLASAYPDDSLLGVVFGERRGTSRFRWVIDPIDGTVSFVHGVPLYGTILGLELDGSPVAGVVVMPVLDEIVWGGAGLGAWHERGTMAGVSSRVVTPAKVSAKASLRDATIAMTSLDYCVQAGMPELYARVQKSCAVTRGWSDCYALVLAATGRIDAVVEPVMKPWDIAGIMPIIEAAGGTCTDFQGKRSISTGTSVVSNGAVHDELLRVVAR